MTTYRIDLVDEDDARRVFSRSRTCHVRVKHPRYEHFDEVRTGDRKNGTLASPAIARASRSYQYPAGPPSAHRAESCRPVLKLARILESRPFPERLLWPLYARDVGKRHLDLIFSISRARLFPRTSPSTGTACICRMKKIKQRSAAASEPRNEDLHQQRLGFRRLSFDLDVVLQQIIDQWSSPGL